MRHRGRLQAGHFTFVVNGNGNTVVATFGASRESGMLGRPGRRRIVAAVIGLSDDRRLRDYLGQLVLDLLVEVERTSGRGRKVIYEWIF